MVQTEKDFFEYENFPEAAKFVHLLHPKIFKQMTKSADFQTAYTLDLGCAQTSLPIERQCSHL